MGGVHWSCGGGRRQLDCPIEIRMALLQATRNAIALMHSSSTDVADEADEVASACRDFVLHSSYQAFSIDNLGNLPTATPFVRQCCNRARRVAADAPCLLGGVEGRIYVAATITSKAGKAVGLWRRRLTDSEMGHLHAVSTDIVLMSAGFDRTDEHGDPGQTSPVINKLLESKRLRI